MLKNMVTKVGFLVVTKSSWLSNLNLLWHKLGLFPLAPSFIKCEKRLTPPGSTLLSGSCREHEGFYWEMSHRSQLGADQRSSQPEKAATGVILDQLQVYYKKHRQRDHIFKNPMHKAATRK